MMIEAYQNLSCLSHSTDPWYIKLHGQTHCHTKYYPKHAHGISDKFDQHTNEHPWYGAGQGTGNAAIWWAIVSHSLIMAYQSEATPWHIRSIIHELLLTLSLNAFVDDMNMIHGEIGGLDIRELISIIQNNKLFSVLKYSIYMVIKK